MPIEEFGTNIIHTIACGGAMKVFLLCLRYTLLGIGNPKDAQREQALKPRTYWMRCRKVYLSLLLTPVLVVVGVLLPRVEGSVWLLPVCAAESATSEAPALEVAPGEITIVVIPDTQSYCRESASFPFSWPGTRNQYLEEAVEWIIAKRDNYSLAFVTHVGDVVDKNILHQWQAAERPLTRILEAGLPFAISVGNHDMEAHEGTSALFQEHFPESKFKGFHWYGGSYPGSASHPHRSGNNANSFQLINAEGHDIMLLHLECNAPDDVLAWADGLLSRHADRLAIVVNHMWLGPLVLPARRQDFIDAQKGRMKWVKCHREVEGNSPEQIWQKLIRKHGNIALVLSGDQRRTQTMVLSSKGDAGNLVHQLMFDHGNGRYLRLLKFSADMKSVSVVTWDIRAGEPLRGTERVSEEGAWQFSLHIDRR